MVTVSFVEEAAVSSARDFHTQISQAGWLQSGAAIAAEVVCRLSPHRDAFDNHGSSK